MDTGFDMNTNFSPAASRNNIWMMLSPVGMERYADQLIQKGVDFHTFANMTRDDMRLVGITNHNDQDILMAITKPMSRMYNELNPKPVKWSKVVSNLHDQTLTLAGSLVSLRKSLAEMPIEHSLVDQDTPSTKAIRMLLKLIDSRVNLIRSDVQQLMKKRGPGASREKSFLGKKIFITGTLLTGAVIIGAYAIVFRHKITS